MKMTLDIHPELEARLKREAQLRGVGSDQCALQLIEKNLANIKRPSLFKKNIEELRNWTEVSKAFDELPKPSRQRDEDGEFHQKGWIHRGHKSEIYRLEPTIERECPAGGDWAEIEYRILQEFQSKAPMHMVPSRLPPPGCKLSWLATMQHYGAPTRLLDFTYSPYVALYFALRHRGRVGGFAEVWAIDADAVLWKAKEAQRQAEIKARKQQGSPKLTIWDGNFQSEQAMAREQDDHRNKAIRNALAPDAKLGKQFNRNGLVEVASPPVQNSRLSSQQGVFLFNAADELSFEESLNRMMRGDRNDQWYKRFRISDNELHTIEAQLFQMNIHDLSLFPDAEGLAGFARQRIRLHL